MDKLTQLQIVEILKKVKEHTTSHPYIRTGQAFFNILYVSYPKQAEAIRGTKYDPFYVDDKLDSCIAYLKGDIEDKEIPEDVVEQLVEVGMAGFWNDINEEIFHDVYYEQFDHDELIDKVHKLAKSQM